MDRFIEVDNSFMLSEEYDNKEKFLTLIIRSFSDNPTGSAIIGVKDMLTILSMKNETRNRSSLKDTLDSMCKKGILSIFGDIAKMHKIDSQDIKHNETYIMSVSDVSHAKVIEGDRKANYKKLSFKELKKFMEINESNKSIAFTIYYNISKRIFEGDNQWKATNVTIETIIKDTGCSKNTITKYLKVLQDNEILDYKSIREGSKTKNYYCKWCDRDSFDDHISALIGYQNEKYL